MTVTLTTTVPANEIKANDLIDGYRVAWKRTLDVNVEVQLVNDLGTKTRRIRKDANVDVVRTVNTWQDELDKAIDRLDAAVAEVRKSVADAEANETAARWAAKFAENPTANNMLYVMSWDTLKMATELHIEKLMQNLGHQIVDDSPADCTDHAATILAFVDRCRDDLLDWNPGRSTSPSSNLVGDAERDALQEIARGRSFGFSSVAFAARYVERLTAAAPADRSVAFDRNAFQMMDDAS